MNKNINKLYAVIKNNEIVAIDTNLSDMHKDFEKLVPEISYTQLYNWFKKDKTFSKKTKSGIEYHFQMIENENY